MQSILDVVKQAETFDNLHKELTDWLGTVESSVSRDLEDSFLSGPDDQADTVFQVSGNRILKCISWHALTL